VEFRVLGPLEVVDADRQLELGGRRQRALLACLLIHANEVVAAERLVEELWGGGAAGANALQISVSRLRKALGPDERLLTRPPGYLLRVGPGELDRDDFERRVDEARRSLEQGRAAEAAVSLRHALALWRGPPFTDFAYEPFAQAEIARLEEARLACLEERIEADLALGRHTELIGELEALTHEHALRERLRAQLMLALYRCGRQADALELYRETRELFDHKLGIEPSPALRRIEAAILRQDPELELPAAAVVTKSEESVAVEAPPALSAVRKTVTVLVSGLGDPAGPAVDPELLRRLGEQAFARLGPVLERHGAAVKRLGDGRVMAVFGVPAAHEDDALRAVRAAVELADGSAHADTVRTGIDSGEVLTGDATSGQPLVTGAVVDAAASLQQLSDPGEILVGEATRRLVRDATRCEPIDLVDGPGPVWRLLELLPGAPPFQRRFDAPLVGRNGELAQLRQAFERARHERRAQLFTVFGEAGIGKTRLAQELARSVQEEATVLTGRCLSYGEGITYWPVIEIVEQATAGRDIRELLDGSSEADVIAARLESAIGSGTSGAVSQEVFWAFRKLAEALAGELPVVLVFEDVHWGEPTLLDLIEHLADWVRTAPVLIVCLARPELLDGRPTWGGGKLNASSILLEPLSEEESAQLTVDLSSGTDLAPAARARIVAAAAGNPLFLEQMLALLAEGEADAAETEVPPAIQALLAARLDRLEPDERRVLACGSIEGDVFHVVSLVELVPPESREALTGHLMSLVRKELIRAQPPDAHGDAFGFRHALIRDAAYEGLSKATRSELHAGHAAWLEELQETRVGEYEELLGYHLEQAYRYRAELHAVDDQALGLADRARLHLASAGRLAFRRGDTRAAINLLERARALPASDERARLELAPDLGVALFEVGALERAESLLSDAIERARAIGERHGERHAWLVRELSRLFVRPDLIDVATSLREAEESLAVLKEAGDDLALARAYRLIAALCACSDPVREQEAAERALEYSRRAGSRPDEAWSLGFLAYTLLEGPTSAEEGVLSCERLLSELGSDPLGEATVEIFLASFLALQSRFERARMLIASSRATRQDIGLGTLETAFELYGSAAVEALAGDLKAAERAIRAAVEHAAEIADSWFYVIASIDLARTVCDQGRPDESLRILDESERHPWFPDLEIVIKRPSTRALALARLGRLEEAEVHAREAVGYADGTGFLGWHADALVVLGEVLRLAGRPTEAMDALEEALGLYERKGNVVSAAKARALLAELR
jgi:DNA-binding SARP family transcriptional activator/tetratricopeptide (TPR) repeat protein